MAYSFPTGVKRRTDCLSMILGDDVAEQHMLAWRQEPGEFDPNNPLVTPASAVGQRLGVRPRHIRA